MTGGPQADVQFDAEFIQELSDIRDNIEGYNSGHWSPEIRSLQGAAIEAVTELMGALGWKDPDDDPV